MSPTAEPTHDTDRALLAELLREIPDFPQPGIRFWDLTTVLAAPVTLSSARRPLLRLA